MCVDIHESAARAHGASPSAKLEPVLAFVDKLTTTPHAIGAEDVRAVYDAGWDEKALHDAVVVACIAGFMNRFVLGLGIDADDAYREAAGRAVEHEGYRARFERRLAREEDDAEG
jgi:alkylhydroperoxidase family enzyme